MLRSSLLTCRDTRSAKKESASGCGLSLLFQLCDTVDNPEGKLVSPQTLFSVRPGVPVAAVDAEMAKDSPPAWPYPSLAQSSLSNDSVEGSNLNGGCASNSRGTVAVVKKLGWVPAARGNPSDGLPSLREIDSAARSSMEGGASRTSSTK